MCGLGAEDCKMKKYLILLQYFTSYILLLTLDYLYNESLRYARLKFDNFYQNEIGIGNWHIELSNCSRVGANRNCQERRSSFNKLPSWLNRYILTSNLFCWHLKMNQERLDAIPFIRVRVLRGRFDIFWAYLIWADTRINWI